MAAIRTDGFPNHIDGPALVAAASGLMLLRSNASRHVRLHRLAALGMAIDDAGTPPASPSAIRSILKRVDIGGPDVLVLEDPYSDVWVQTVTFHGGPFLVSGGSGEHAVADLENFIDAVLRGGWMPDDLARATRRLIRGLLMVSDIVLARAGLARGTTPGGSPRTPVDVPAAGRLKMLADAAFLSNSELEIRGDWLREVIDELAMNPGELAEPCSEDYADDRLYAKPFLRLATGYRVVLPLDLAITIRFHLLRLASEAGQLEELGRRWRDAALRRLVRRLPSGLALTQVQEGDVLSRYIANIDDKRDLHVIVATDPLDDWHETMWGAYDTKPALDRIFELVSPSSRQEYSSAKELVHVVITDSPGRSAFWGIPNVDGADPMLIARSNDLEVMLHHEPDGILGLLLFAQAIDLRHGGSMSTDILDEHSAYIDRDKSFYFSDDSPPTFTSFQTGDGLASRIKFSAETDRHGVALPVPGGPIVQVQRRYERDAPEIFMTMPGGSYLGSIVELGSQVVFITVDLGDAGFVGVEPDLLDCVAYWVRECSILSGVSMSSDTIELVLALSDSAAWQRVGNWSTTDPAVIMRPIESGYSVEFTETFISLLQDPINVAERELVSELLENMFDATGDPAGVLDLVAPAGSKRMINVYAQDRDPDMLAEGLPDPLTGHGQVSAQLLDQLGEWLRSPTGGGFAIGPLTGPDQVRLLNAAVAYLFKRLEAELAIFAQHELLEFLIAQNESLLHNARLTASLLKSRLACFGEQSDTVADLVRDRKAFAAAHRANRFLIEYVAAQPPSGARAVTVLDYYRVLNIAREISERATVSDLIHYGLADVEVSILASGRLGVSREQAVFTAMDTYATHAGERSVRDAQRHRVNEPSRIDGADFVARSEQPMRAEYGFTLAELREVSGGLLDLAAADRVTRIDRSAAVAAIVTSRRMTEDTVNTVISAMTLSARSAFLSIGQDAWPWRFNRDMSFIRRPLVLQGDELVFGYRSIYRLGVYWSDTLLSGRLQGRAKTSEMQRFISAVRGQINDDFARSVERRLRDLGMTTRLAVKKIGTNRIVDLGGKDLGDIDVLVAHPETRSIIAVEAKDFEIARTPAEIANELEKLFSGKSNKKSTIELHTRRIDWLREHLAEAMEHLGFDGALASWQVHGVIITSDPLITPLVRSSSIPVLAFEDVDLDSLTNAGALGQRPSRRNGKRRR